MAGIIKKNAKTTAVIKQCCSIVDGKPVWTTISCLCLVFDFTQADIQYFGAVQNGKIFLVAPLKNHPQLPGMIVLDNVEYDIKGIKIHRNLKGVVLGYRIAVAGAS